MTLSFILYLLMCKHALADLVLQSRLSGDKLDLRTSKGWLHALDHAALSVLVLIFFVPLHYSIVLGVLDFVLHFTIDYCKTLWVRRKGIKYESKTFWTIQGVDQVAHFSCYMLYTALIGGFIF